MSEEYIVAKDERVDSFIERMVGLFGLGGFESAYDIPPPLWLNAAQLVMMTKKIVEDVARDGNTILVGRGANRILEDHPNALHVFLYAPLDRRIERVMPAATMNHAEAKKRVVGMDKLRADYVHAFYHDDWRDPSHYNLLIDTSQFGENTATDLIAWALENSG